MLSSQSSQHLVNRGPLASLANLPSSKVAQSQSPIPPAPKTMQKFGQGRYFAKDVRWGMSLDLSGEDRRSLIGFDKFHGGENQQARASRPFAPQA
jgi:hypothetical protein